MKFSDDGTHLIGMPAAPIKSGFSESIDYRPPAADFGVGEWSVNGSLNYLSDGVNWVEIPTVSSTSTLSNKRLTRRSNTVASAAAPAINTDVTDFFYISAQAADITSFTTNLTGTPVSGQLLWVAIIGTATRAVAWGASFESSTVALPTTTVGTARIDVGFVWNPATNKWRCIAVA